VLFLLSRFCYGLIMAEITFVEVTGSRMEMRACEIAEQSYAQGQRLQIIALDEEQAARLDDLLWTHKPDNFIPHGIWKSMDSESDQPVVITTRKEQVPGIAFLLTMDYCPVEMVQQFSKVIHVVVVDNQERLEASRRYWTLLKDAGFSLKHQKR
ncbi:MAG: DNA polymerase III subunit chi, partial [Syntrophobacterales bacterium]